MVKNSIRMGTVADAALTHFSTLLRIRRKERKLTIAELADRLGVSVPTVRSLLAASPGVSIGTYFEAAHILGVALFDPETSRFTATAAKDEKLETLLPQRVREKKVELDDDF